MRDTILILLMIISSSTANFAQTNESECRVSLGNYKPLKDDPSPAIKSKGKKLKRLGIALTGGGVLALAGGVGLLADAGTFSINHYKSFDFSFKHLSVYRIVEKSAGYTLIDIGTYAVAGGIVMIIIGNRKIRKEKARVNFTFTPVSAGVCYRF